MSGIYAAPLTPLAPPLAVSRQSYGSPISRVWVLEGPRELEQPFFAFAHPYH